MDLITNSKQQAQADRLNSRSHFVATYVCTISPGLTEQNQGSQSC